MLRQYIDKCTGRVSVLITSRNCLTNVMLYQCRHEPILEYQLTHTMNIPDSPYKRVVIIGGGFAGMTLAQKLRREKLQVVIIDKFNHHTFQPLLYQVATAGLEPNSVAYPLRKVFQKAKNVSVRICKLQKVYPAQQRIETSIGSLDYDYLVIATGSAAQFFNFNPAHLLPLKSVANALDIRNLILQRLERASTTTDPDKRRRLLNWVVVGGGPTGVEMAGAFGEMKKFIIPTDYPDIESEEVRILLYEGGPRLLAGMSDHAGRKAKKYLEQLGVEVHLDTRLEHFDGRTLHVGDGTTLETEQLIWGAGVSGAAPDGFVSEILTKDKRVRVNTYNQVQGYHNIFAIGDVAHMETEDYPDGHPMLAQVALQQGTLLASNLPRLVAGQSLEAFDYLDKGVLATVGRNRGVGDIKGIKVGGFIGWF